MKDDPHKMRWSSGAHIPRADDMTLLDYFAAKALQGLLAHYGCETGLESLLAQRAYHIADLMVQER